MEFMAMGVRCLHAREDVILLAMLLPLANYNAATSWSLIRTIAVNVARMCGYAGLPDRSSENSDNERRKGRVAF